MRTPIAVALIVFLLLRLAFEAAKTVGSLLELVRLVRANLMQRRDTAMLRQPDQAVPRDDRQFSIDWWPA